MHRSLGILICAAALLPAGAGAAPCPAAGGTLALSLSAVDGAPAMTSTLTGMLEAPACDTMGGLATAYELTLTCDPTLPDSCAGVVVGLQPGRWVHRIQSADGEAAGRLQARRTQILDASAGTHQLAWQSYRSVHTVRSLEDAVGCRDCLRAALADANLGRKPALLQFEPAVAGPIVLATALPALTGGQVTVDGFDVDAEPYTRTLDANGLSNAALRITSAGNHITGLRVTNVGGDADALLIEGPDANANLIDTVTVVGRAVEVCQVELARGCVVDGVCMVPSPALPRGACGDDGIAIRNFAGAGAANVIRRADVSGAYDKGIKVSDRGVARVERSLITGNADGGLQATLSGTLVAVENEVRGNRGTGTASGIAANGATSDSLAPAILQTRGNLAVDNALRGLSVRSLSIASLRDDFACGNGTVGRDDGFGVAVFDAAGRAAVVGAHGVAAVHNVGGGAAVGNLSQATFGSAAAFGHNAFAFNGSADPLNPSNLRNLTEQHLMAVGNQWEHCGPRIPCDVAQVRSRDVFDMTPTSTVAVTPALATPNRDAPVITSIEPTFATAGELVRIYGTGFDAIEGAGTSCAGVAAANACRPVRGNCVFIDRQPASVVAVTPTMLVVRAPFTCVAPVTVATRTRRSRGFGRAPFCTVPARVETL